MVAVASRSCVLSCVISGGFFAEMNTSFNGSKFSCAISYLISSAAGLIIAFCTMNAFGNACGFSYVLISASPMSYRLMRL